MNAETWQRLKPLFHAALDLGPAERDSFLATACDGDVALRAQVERLLSSHDEPGDFLVSPAAVCATDSLDEAKAEIRSGERIGPYEIVRELGHGGMGTVFLAVRADDQYRKQVAIKLIKRGMDTDLILRRFRMERQILANLEHPNIARLLEGGSTADGLPYFVMEYIEGQPVTEYCEARQFTINERLELFRQVCAALQYAHQNLVVHRDIKPSNILVTPEGVPKLLDFGIAKLLSPEWAETTGATASMVRLMTPGYASPEQLRGLAITTGSDVYSLGVVLYELLSGRHPYRLVSSQPEEVAEIVLREEPQKPSLAASRPKAEDPNATQEENRTTSSELSGRPNPQPTSRNPKSLRGDLDNIVFKAMRKEPERRYASVQELSEDIRRHLEGLPVTASPDTLAYRAHKFFQRHRVSVTASAFTLLALLAGITATTWQGRRANLERAKAERRANEMRKLSRYLMTDVFESLSVLPNASQVQKDLTQSGIRYLDALAHEETEDVVLLGELASSYIKLGEVQTSRLHDTRAALQSFQKAVELQRKRIARAPGDAQIRRDLVLGLGKTGEVLSENGRAEPYLQVRSEIQQVLQELLDANPGSVEDLFNLGGNHQARGEMLKSLKRNEEARNEFQIALLLITKAIELSKHAAQTPEDKIGLSFKYLYQADVFTYLEDWHNVVASSRQSCEIADAVWRENPTLRAALSGTTRSHRRLAAALERVGDYQGALENYQYSLRTLTEAEANNPGARELRRPVAIYKITVGAALHRVGETARGIKMVKEGLDLHRELLAETTVEPGGISFAYEIYQPAADFFLTIGQREEAIAVYREWVRHFESIRETVYGEPAFVWGSATIYSKLGDVQSGFNEESKSVHETNRARLNEARRWYQKSLAALAELRELGNNNASAQQLTAATEDKLAQCEKRLQ
jgi:eukaryotic-like serine/threonine-protein kinase